METKTTEGLIGPDWPTKEKYIELKAEFFRENKTRVKKYLDGLFYIKELPRNMREAAQDMCLNFEWGKDLSARVYRFEGAIPPLEIIPYGGESPSTESKLFYTSVHDLGASRPFIAYPRIIQALHYAVGKPGTFKPAIKDIPLNDFAVLGGFHEMAHTLFIKVKKGLGNPSVKVGGDFDATYASADIEERALIGQVAFTKRYMPQYHKRYADLLERTVAIRATAKALDKNKIHE